MLLLLLLPTALALDTNIPCDFPVYDKMPDDWEDKAFIVKNTVPSEFRKEVELSTLYEKYGEYEIGIDHPSHRKPPTEHWQKTTMGEYIDNHVMKFHNMSIEDRLKDTEYFPMTLFGPTDILLKGYGHNMIPDRVQNMFECVSGVRVFGLSVKGTGYHFHHHGQVFNRLVYGKKIWLLSDEDHLDRFGDKPMSSIIDTLLREREELGIRVCVTEAGDSISVPHETYHATFSLETSFFGVCALENYPKPWWSFGSGVVHPYWYKMMEELRSELMHQRTVQIEEARFEVEEHMAFIEDLLGYLEVDYTISSTLKDNLIMSISHCDGYTYWAPYPTTICPTSVYLIANTRSVSEFTGENTRHRLDFF